MFYSLHHIFLTRYGIYLVVFDMRKILSKEESRNAKEYLEFWLKSIKAHAPNAKFILVGTHHDIIQSNKDLDSIDDVLSEELSIEQYQNNLVFNETTGRFFFPLNNASSDLNRASALRIAIESTMRDEKYIKELVSLCWIKSMDDMRALKHKVNLDFETEIIPIANKNQIFEREEIVEMLSLFHRLGIFVFVSMSPTLSSRVITQPKWLLENLTKLIRDPSMHVSKEELAKLKSSFLNKDFKRMLSTGEVSQKLINKLLPANDLEYVVEFMEQTLLLCRLGKDSFFVPSLSSGVVLGCPSLVNGFKFWLQFDYLPDGLFQRLICLIVSDQHEEINFAKPEIHRSTALLRIDSTDIFCQVEGNALVFRFSKRGDVLKLRNQVYRLTKIIVQKFLGEMKPPIMFLVPSGFEDGPLVGQSFEMVKSFRDTKTEISLTNKVFVDVSKFDAFFGSSREYESIELGDFDTFLSHAWGNDHVTHKQVERIAHGLKEQKASR